MAEHSAGILAWRMSDSRPQVLLVHPGGPFFAKKDAGAWSVPKGLTEGAEDALGAARREFAEEVGVEVHGDFRPLNPVKMKSGKIISAWAVAADVDITEFRSNTFAIEWPPNSGKMKAFPEVDKAGWFAIDEARVKLNPAQIPFLDELLTFIA